MVTKLCGFTPNRHEGKITGLAAFGEPKYKDTIASLYEIDDIGRIIPKFKSYRTLYEILNDIFKKDEEKLSQHRLNQFCRIDGKINKKN